MPSRYIRLPYRLSVGVLLIGPSGLVCVEQKAAKCAPATSADGWQMPEGSIDPHEPPREAGLRLLRDVMGFGRAQVLAEAPGWFSYELPADMLGVALDGRHCGQKQRWIAARAGVQGRSASPARRWVPANAVPRLAPFLKRELYEDVVATFAPLLHRPAVESARRGQPARTQPAHALKAAAVPWFVTLLG
jgi:putative (di)nucleoside polyphosphate hydrolase